MRKVLIAAAAAVVLAGTVPALADVYTVNPGESIQAAIDGAGDGDTINVAAGTYNEQINLNKSVSVVGAGAASTVLDGTGLTVTSSGLVRIADTTGTARLDGFTIQNSPLKTGGSDRFAILAFDGLPGSTQTVTNCVITGNGYSDTEGDWGLYSSNNQAHVEFTNNTVSNIGWNALCFEKSVGPTTIAHNNLTLTPDDPWGASPGVFSMSYGTEAVPNHVTTKQWIHHNTIDANGGSGICFASAIGLAGYGERMYGKYTDIEISNNEITNVGDYNKGIQLEMDGDEGGFDNPVITGNTISAKNPGSGTSRGIRLLGTVTDADIAGNAISGFYRGIYQSGTWGQPIYADGTGVTCNALADNVNGIEVDGGTLSAHFNDLIRNTQYAVQNDGSNTVDAKNNWWGTTVQAEILALTSGSVDFDPWLSGPSPCAPPIPEPAGLGLIGLGLVGLRRRRRT